MTGPREKRLSTERSAVNPRGLSAGGFAARRKRRHAFAMLFACLIILTGAGVVWLSVKASVIRTELIASTEVVPRIKDALLHEDAQAAASAAEQLEAHTSKARVASSDPLWILASSLPWLGANFAAASEISQSADDVAEIGIVPLVKVYGSIQWDQLLQGGGGQDLASIRTAAPTVATAAQAVRVSGQRLAAIDEEAIVDEIALPLSRIEQELDQLADALDGTASAAGLASPMLGEHTKREYLLMIQNNAESRASGGIPGALAILSLDNGKLSLGAQTSASELGVISPSIPVEQEQLQIYSGRLGKFMQDVNLTPNFPTTAATAKAMWERKTGQRVDGVISIDPVALSYMLEATGPVKISNPELVSLARGGLPTELNSKNVVQTLLSDVYAKIEEPQLQDAYFAGVAQEIFSALSSGKGDAKGLVDGITRGTAEGRVLVWSSNADEQTVIANYPLSGSIAGPSVAPAQFGVYFNDGTGAKMDYYVKRTVQLVEECTGDEYGQVKARITSINTAPSDAATSLPEYVTGGGAFGVPPGTVQTNVIAYGPAQANVETATVDGKKTDFAAHRQSNRPVGSVTITLAPGQTSTVELTFGKIVQHTEPNLVVTPTVQPVKDVVLGTKPAKCIPAK